MRLGEWELQSSEMCLTKGDDVAQMTPLAWSVLLHLIAHRDRLVTPRELLEKFWRGDLSDASAVRKAVHEIRQSLGDDPKDPAIVKTVARKGYRLVADVEDDDPSAAHAIAVLPFDPLGDSAGGTGEGESIAEDVLTELSRRTSVPVIGRSASFMFGGGERDMRQIGQRIGASHVVEGSVRVDGGQMRVTAELIAADSGHIVWGKRYHAAREDARLPREIAADLARALNDSLGYATLTPTSNHPVWQPCREAREHYQAGRHLTASGDPTDATLAVERLRRAVALEPDYREAWTALALAYLNQSQAFLYTRTLADVLPDAERAARQALSLDPRNGAALAVLGWLNLFARFDIETALEQFERAVEYSPNDGWVCVRYAWALNWLGDERADPYFEHARRVAPLDPMVLFVIAVHHVFRGEEAQALRLMDALVAGGGETFANHICAGLINAFSARFQVARHHLNQARRLAKPDFPAVLVLAYYVELNKDVANPDVLSQHLDQIERVSRTQPTPMLVTMGWPAHQIETIWQRAIDQCQDTVFMYACLPKPSLMSDEFWRYVQNTVGVEAFRRGDRQSIMRAAVDRTALVDAQLELPPAALDRYVGDYAADDEIPVTVERRGHELWITFPDSGDYHQLIPTAEHEFEFFGFYRSIRFQMDGDDVSGLLDADPSNSVSRNKVRGR